MTTSLEEPLRTDLLARWTGPDHKTQRAHCMTCGRGLDPAKAAKGGPARFCSGRCMDAYDAGWPVYGTTLADYATKTAHRNTGKAAEGTPAVTQLEGLTPETKVRGR